VLFTLTLTVIGGTLEKDQIFLIADGQMMEVPLSQSSRGGISQSPAGEVESGHRISHSC